MIDTQSEQQDHRTRFHATAGVAAVMLAAACVVMLQAPALAQEGAAAAGRACAAIDDDAERLACYDWTFERAETSGRGAERAGERAQSDAAPVPDSPAPASRSAARSLGDEGRAAGGSASTAQRNAPELQASPAQRSGAERQAAAARRSAVEPPAAASAAPAEPVAETTIRSTAPPSARPRETEEPQPIQVTVVDVRVRPDGAVFVLDNGETWTQTDARRFFAPDTPFGAEIRPGALGSYFLAPEEGGRAVRVRFSSER